MASVKDEVSVLTLLPDHTQYRLQAQHRRRLRHRTCQRTVPKSLKVCGGPKSEHVFLSSFHSSGLAILAETALAKEANWALAGMSGMPGEVGWRPVDIVNIVKLVYGAMLKGFKWHNIDSVGYDVGDEAVLIIPGPSKWRHTWWMKRWELAGGKVQDINWNHFQRWAKRTI